MNTYNAVIHLMGYTIELEYSYQCRPAQLYGPMEDCHPEESDFEYTIKRIVPDDPEITQDQLDSLLVKEALVFDALLMQRIIQ